MTAARAPLPVVKIAGQEYSQLCEGIQACSPVKRGDEPRFALEKFLGKGGLCEVYAAKDLKRLAYGDTSPYVAIKKLLPEYAEDKSARKLLAQEFFIARHVTHSGAVRVFDLHEESWGIALSMELLQGENLHEAQARYPHGMGKAGLVVARSLFEVLDSLHGAGIVHGDVKPANIMLESGNRVVLFDFNSSEVRARAGSASSPLSQGLRAALRLPTYSLLYASPERLGGCGASFEDDVYAACCTICEALTGVHPFMRKTSLEAFGMKLKPKMPGSVSGRQGQLLLQGLSPSSVERPSARELARAFSEKNLLSRLLASADAL